MAILETIKKEKKVIPIYNMVTEQHSQKNAKKIWAMLKKNFQKY